ncbi:ATP-binding cassette sub- F member 1 [Desmophyllum pertusum]|uniref:ATP-binding cassette sub- F member 1 n=1 Tax=Desmophyllum pertusum TaxID=174260 RepID=A0A9W9ZD97_9CNID|nr:ATP-binding cassette sub- F member 1 [Desmophyllum pertusum]
MVKKKGQKNAQSKKNWILRQRGPRNRRKQRTQWICSNLAKKRKGNLKKKAKFETETQEVAGSQFSVSQQESSAKTAVLENALDIKVEKFSISARGKDLFVNANLNITAGRRYGLVDQMGKKKSTNGIFKFM